jgi:hypothetical protein
MQLSSRGRAIRSIGHPPCFSRTFLLYINHQKSFYQSSSLYLILLHHTPSFTSPCPWLDSKEIYNIQIDILLANKLTITTTTSSFSKSTSNLIQNAFRTLNPAVPRRSGTRSRVCSSPRTCSPPGIFLNRLCCCRCYFRSGCPRTGRAGRHAVRC